MSERGNADEMRENALHLFNPFKNIHFAWLLGNRLTVCIQKLLDVKR
jgi:hypothetical protein